MLPEYGGLIVSAKPVADYVNGERLQFLVYDTQAQVLDTLTSSDGLPNANTGTLYEGTGLGLSISYDLIVQEHGGEIRVESEEGSFTEFVICLQKP